MLDIAPLDITEVEKYYFETVTVFWEDLSHNLKTSLEQVIRKIYSCVTIGQAKEELAKHLADFNAHEIYRNLDQPTLVSKAEAKATIDTNWNVNLWVEFTGIKEQTIDRLPKGYRRKVYDLLTPNWRDLFNDPEYTRNTLFKIIKDATSQYIGGHHTKDQTSDIVKDINKALSNYDLLDEYEIELNYPRINIKARFTSSHATNTISIYVS